VVCVILLFFPTYGIRAQPSDLVPLVRYMYASAITRARDGPIMDTKARRAETELNGQMGQDEGDGQTGQEVRCGSDGPRIQ